MNHARAPGLPWRVVIIDDNPEDRADARRMLLKGAARRYIFTEAENGATGIRAVLACAGGAPDCVVLDYDLPDMVALDVLAELEGPDGLQRCPVVVLTGSDATEPGRKVLRAGAHDYIGKDWMTPAALTRAIDNAAERWAMSHELRGRETELQTLANNIPDVLTRFDRQLRYVFVNAAIETIGSHRKERYIGRTNRDLRMPVARLRQSDKALRTVFASGQPLTLEFQWTGPIGPRHFSCRLVPEFGADAQVEYVLGVTHDITDQKQFERGLRDADQRKDEFLATLAHELRNPLAPVLNGLSILRMGVTPAQLDKTVAMMSRQLAQLVNLVDDLLDVSRLNLDKIELRIERLDIAEAIEEAVEGCRPLIEACDHVLVVELSRQVLAVDGDRTRLVQIVANLLTNAAKYTEPGGTIRVGVTRDRDDAVIRVRDSGVGIASEALPTLWNMFTQVRDTIEKAQGGLGIGLSLVKKLVEMHAGSVVAESAGVGHGSQFIIRLPLATTPGVVALAPSGALVLAGPRITPPTVGRRILVVDDNQDTAQSLATLLRMCGHEPVVAHDGPEALESARGFDPELILLDIGLPGMDGYEVARHLRADPTTASTTLVAITGWGNEEDKLKARQAGFDFHLTKPVHLHAVEALLKAHQTKSEVARV